METGFLGYEYGWNLSSSDWLIRIYLSGGLPREVIFNNSKIMQAYIFGDGSGNSFRFCVDDNFPNSSSFNHEVTFQTAGDYRE